MRRLGSLLLVVGLGCGTRALPTTSSEVPDCDARVVEGGVCPGAPTIVCAGRCSVEADCTTTLEVPSPAEVDRLRAAPRGACARLGDGDYPAVSVEDVSLYGAGEARVRLQGLAVSATERVRIRGLRVGAGGLSARGTGEVVLQGVRVMAASDVGVRATPPVRLALDRVTIEDSGGFGLVRECASDAPTTVTLAHVLVTKARGVGLLLCDATATLRGVLVDRTLPKDFAYGRAIELQGGALVATATLLANGAEAGLLATGGTATLGPGFFVDGHQPAVLLGKASEGLLTGFALKGARGAGLVVGAGGRVMASKGTIEAVELVSIPTSTGAVASVGDCVEASAHARLDVTPEVFLSGCARRPAVLDATATGTFLARLRTADPARPVVLQGDEPSLLVLAPDLAVEKRARASSLPLLVTP